MMTAYIVERELDEGRISMSDMVPISVKAWRTEGSRTFVQEGTSVSVEDLLKGVIIEPSAPRPHGYRGRWALETGSDQIQK